MAGLNRRLFHERVAAAVRFFPLYAAKVRAHTAGVPVDRVTDPAGLPLWTKQDQRALFASLKGPPLPGSFVHASGGSTGVPVQFYMTRESFEWRMAVSDRGYSWAGAEEGRKSFYVWGSPIKALSRQMKFKLALQHAIQRREYFDSFVFDDAHRAACCHAINRFRPPALVGYAGNLVELALYARAHPEALRWKARSLVTAAEGLQPGQRQLLEATLADEVFMSYGSREFMLIGMECPEHRGYHLSADTLLVEVVDDCGQPLPPGKAGRIVVTDLRNAANPFIRYEIGDLGTMAAEPCPCGLPFPLLQSVEGRIQEFLLASDGSRQTALFIPHLMKEFRWVRGYQLVQADPTHVRVNVVTETALVPAAVEPIVQALKGKLGQAVNVSVESVPALRKSATGKVPIVIQESPASTG